MTDELKTIPLAKISEDPDQPRRSIDEELIDDMAETIKTVGLIEPVTVRPAGAQYMLVVGHRRYRAAKAAGLKELPCIVRDVGDLEVMRMQAVEDVQTKELDPRDRYAFWAKLWHAEKSANAALTMAQFSREVLGMSERYVKAGINVAESAPEGLKEIMGSAEEGKLSPGYARYLVDDSSLAPDEKVAVGRKIAANKLPASGGKIGTETLKTIRTAPPKIRERLIHDPDFSLEEARWEIESHERGERFAAASGKEPMGAGELSFKFLRALVDFHVKVDDTIAPFLPEEAWEEVSYRIDRLIEKLQEFKAARDNAIPDGEELIDVVDADALRALLAQSDEAV